MREVTRCARRLGVQALTLYAFSSQNWSRPADEVAGLMETITADPRHAGVSVLDRRTIDERTCPDWAMKRVMIAESISNRREMLERDLPDGLAPEVRKMIVNFAVLN